MDLKPAAVTPELASAALASPALSRAVMLAEWVGEGRETSTNGLLRPAVAEQACTELDIVRPDTGGKLRSAQDVPELMIVWNVARVGGLITVDANHAHGATPDGPDATVDAWLRGVGAVFGLPDEPCSECLTALAAIAQAENGTIKVADVLESVVRDQSASGVCPDCGGFHNEGHDVANARHAADSLEDLLFFGALAIDGNGDTNSIITLTPLGRMLADSVFALLAPAPEDSATAAASRLADLSGPTAFRYAAAWLAARTPETAVRELLDVAESGTPRQRLTAVDVAAEIGPQAAAVWRERAKAPGYGAQIRSWLTAWGEDVPNFPRDDAWLAADHMSAVYEQVPPDVVAARILTQLEGADLDGVNRGYVADLVASLGKSGHPDAPRLIELVRAANSQYRLAAPASDTAKPLQLTITLRGVDDPPVWRRIAVPGSTTLDRLHSMIQDAMGWENDHMHAFYAGRRELGNHMPLREVIPNRGSSFQYMYDFGDGWTHDIKSEGFYHNDKGFTLPVCLDGSGACPPEECGGPDGYYYLKEAVADPENDQHDERLDWLGLDSAVGFDPSAFSVEEANARVARPLPDEAAGSPVITVVRTQRRTRKPKSKR